MIDRDRFAADIYLRLLDGFGVNKDPQWIKEEANRRADDFLSDLESRQPKSKVRRRETVTT